MRHLLRDAVGTTLRIGLLLVSVVLALTGWIYTWWLTPLGIIGIVVAITLMARSVARTARGAARNPQIGQYTYDPGINF